MALFTCSFEAGNKTYYEDLGWTFWGSTTQVIDDTGGTQAPADAIHRSLQGSGGDFALEIEDGAETPVFSKTARWLHFWMYPALSTTSMNVVFYTNANSTTYQQAFVQFGYTGAVSLYGPGNGYIGSSDKGWDPNRPHWVAIEMFCGDQPLPPDEADPPIGFCRVYVDGELVLQETGVDLCAARWFDGSTHHDETWDHVTFSGGNIYFVVDDIVVTTSGEGQLHEYFTHLEWPTTAIGGFIDWTPLSGLNWTSVNDESKGGPDGDSSYVESTTAGDEDRYASGTTMWTPDDIHCVKVSVYGTRGDGTTITGIDLGLTSNVTTDYQPITFPNGSYEGGDYIWNTDPDTAAAWTKSGVEATRYGFVST